MLGRRSFPFGARPSGRCEMLLSGEYIYIYFIAIKCAVRIQKTRGNCRCLPPNTPGDRTENRTRVAGLSILCSVTQWSSSESVPWVVEALSFHKSWEGRYFFWKETGKIRSFPLTAKWFPKNMLKQTERIWPAGPSSLGANNVLVKETRLWWVDM